MGVQATQPIGPNEWFIKVPNSLILYSRDAHTEELDPIFKAHPEVFATGVYCCEEAKLCAFMIRGKTLPDFKWKAFLNCKGHDENLADWNDDELEQLQDPELTGEAKKKQALTHKIWAVWSSALSQHPDVFSSEDISEESFNSYWKYIENRSFGFALPWIALVPVVEFINHSICDSYYSYDPGHLQHAARKVDYFEPDEDYDDIISKEDFMLPITCLEIVQLLKLKAQEAAGLEAAAIDFDDAENTYSKVLRRAKEARNTLQCWQLQRKED